MLAINFLICNLAIMLILFIIYILKHLFKKHLTARSNYRLGILLLFLLPVLLIPFHPFKAEIFEPSYTAESASDVSTVQQKTSSDISSILEDRAILVQRTDLASLDNFLMILWLTGAIITFIKTLYTNYHFIQIKRFSLPNQSEEFDSLLHDCLQELHINKRIRLQMTSELNTPAIIGIMHPYILLPSYSLQALSTENLRYIFLHELQHYRRCDLLINYFICIIRVFYWFNPAVRYLLNEIRQSQEIMCDMAVLHIISPRHYTAYGHALIDFAELVSNRKFYPLYHISGSYRQMSARIFEIANYKEESILQKFGSYMLIVFAAILIFYSTPALDILAAPDNGMNLEDINYTTIDLSNYFSDYDGSFVLYNLNQKTYSLYSPGRCTKRTAPDSTYKIYSALAGLEASKIGPENTSQPWSGEIFPFEEWNRSQTLDTAMKNSVNWYFQNLDRKVGRQYLQKFFNHISYGNKDLSGGLGDFWLESSLKISPLEQALLLTEFYQNDWDFSQQNMDAVKASMYISTFNGGRLYGKTGTGNVNGKLVNGWFIGFIETDSNAYIFAANIQGTDHCSGAAAAEITLDILSDQLLP